ncbi:MAG: DUF3108 domain-containing protein [Candidatus Omnitrophica bacterium]|nr:DUF3108 domain-containing protein [Candidatus Omnitrophota bacterium]
MRSKALLFSILLLGGCARATITSVETPLPPAEQQPTPETVSPVEPDAGTGPVIPALKELPIGEELEYEIHWLGIPVGLVTMKVNRAKEGASELSGLLELSCFGRSNKYLDAFYPVRIQLTSFFDPQSRMPRRFEASVKRRQRKHESVVTFKQEKKEAFHQLPKGKTATVPLTSQTQDGVSLVHYSRLLPFRLGQTVPFQVTADGANWDLKARILKINKVSLRGLKKWRAFEGDLELAYPVPFFQGAKAHLWFSADEERVPLLAKIHSRIGPVTVVLIRRSKSSLLENPDLSS